MIFFCLLSKDKLTNGPRTVHKLSSDGLVDYRACLQKLALQAVELSAVEQIFLTVQELCPFLLTVHRQVRKPLTDVSQTFFSDGHTSVFGRIHVSYRALFEST